MIVLSDTLFYAVAFIATAASLLFAAFCYMYLSSRDKITTLLEFLNTERALNKYLNDELFDRVTEEEYRKIVRKSMEVADQNKIDETFEQIVRDYR